MTVSITEDSLITVLRSWLMTLITGEVVQAQDNRVAMPVGNFCLMTPLMISGLSTDRSEYTDLGVNPSQQSHVRSTQWTCQLDFYGSQAGDNAATVSTMVRTNTAAEYFAASGVDMAPLYSSEPRQTTLINAENQQENRWTMDFVAQFNPVVISAADLATQLTPTVVRAGP